MHLNQEKNPRASGHYAKYKSVFSLDKHLLQYHSILLFLTPLPRICSYIRWNNLLHLLHSIIYLSNNLLSDFLHVTKLQNNITVTIFGKHLLIRYSHRESFADLSFSAKHCRNYALIIKILNFALNVIFFPVTMKRTHANANMSQ